MTWFRGLLIAAALLVPALAWADNQTIGTAAAVNPAATGTAPGGESQTLLIGSNVVFKERIKTTAIGQTQLLFVDQSMLTVAPNSDVVIDEFVYDPKTSTGTMALSLGRGLLRFVGGQISHNSGATIRTPTVALTVRGSNISVQYQPGQGSSAGQTTAFLASGEGTLTPANGGEPIPIHTGDLATQSAGGTPTVAPATTSDVSNLTSPFLSTSNTTTTTTGAVGSALDSNPVTGVSQTTPTSTSGTGTSTGTGTSGGTSGSSSTGSTTSSNGSTNGTSTSSPPSSVQNSVTNTTQTSTTQPGSTAVASAGPFDGRYMVTGSAYTTTFGDVFSNPAAQDAVGGPIVTPVNQGFSTAQISNGRLTITLTTPDNGQTLIDLPIQFGSFTISGPTTTPANGSNVIGTGFYDPTTGFFFYNGVPANGTPGQGVIVGGTPTPNGGLLPGGSIPAFEAWNLQPDITTSIPTLPGTLASQFPNATVSSMLAAFQGAGTIGVGDPGFGGAIESHYLWATLDIEGQGDNQKSLFFGVAGGFFGDGGNLYLSNALRGTVNLGGGTPLLHLDNEFGSVPGAGATATSSAPSFYGPNLNYFVAQQNDPGAGNGAYETDTGFIGTSNGSISYYPYGYTALASMTTAPAALGTNRSSRTLNGYFANMAQSYLPSCSCYETPYAVTNANGSPLDLSITTNTLTNTIQGSFNFGVPVGQSDITHGLLTFGGIGAGRTAYIDDQHMGALDGTTLAGSNLNGDIGITDLSNNHPDGFRSFMVSHDLVGTSGLLPAGVTLCTCEFLEWGYWESKFNWDSNSGNPANNGRQDLFTTGTWVAGDLTSAAQVQGLTGTATFGGDVIANVYDGTAQYLAAGGFSANWNFGTATGTVAINNLDNHNYTGAIATGGGAANNFSGTIASGTISGPLNGSFFNAPTEPAKYMGGSVTAQDSASLYRLSGTFTAERP